MNNELIIVAPPRDPIFEGVSQGLVAMFVTDVDTNDFADLVALLDGIAATGECY